VVKEPAAVQQKAESKNRTAAPTKIFFLPNRSLNSPVKDTPITQPNKADETNQPSCAVDRLNWRSTKGNMPDTTAMSKPNRNPPKEAVIITNVRFVFMLMMVYFK
jgi:hypothetical protein